MTILHEQISVILDTSVFHNFDYSSDILFKLRRAGKITVYITPMLLEESFRLMLHNKASNDMKKRLQFILDISAERWLEDNFEIFKSELSLLPRRKDYQFLSVKSEQILKDNIRKVIAGGGFGDAETYVRANEELRKNVSKASNFREHGKEMRKTVAQKLKGLGKKHKDITETWQFFKGSGLNKWGRGLIRRKECYGKMFQLSALVVWTMNKSKCPYFYDWAQGMLYSKFCDMKYPDMKIDKNAQADIQHLVFLREVDAIISEEKKFMRKAWQDIYAPIGKKYFSVDEIARLC